MSLFDGLKFGRPAYPYYAPEPFKVQEPTALGLLAQLKMPRGKSSSDTDKGSGKGQDIDAIQKQTSEWHDLKNYTEALERNNTAMGTKALMSYRANSGEDYINKFQSSPEGKAYFNNLMLVEKNKSILEKNVPVGKANKEKITKARNDLIEKTSAGLFALSPTYNTYKLDENGNLVENPGTDLEGAITKEEYNNWLDANIGSDPKTGLFLQISPMSGIDQNAFNRKLIKHIEMAKETEGGKWESGPQLGGVPGTFITKSGEHISNLRKLNKVTWNTFDSDLTIEEKDAAHQMYYNAIKSRSPYAFETEEYVDDKGNKAIRHKLDLNKNPIPLKYEDYMTDVVTRGKMGVDIDYYNTGTDYKNIPGWEDQQKAEKGAKYWSLFLAGRRATVDPVTGKRYLGLQYDIGIMDFGEVVGTVKDNVISDIFGESGLLHIKSLKHQYETITPTDKRSKEDLNSFIMKNMGAENMSKYYKYINNPNNKINKESKWGKGSLLHNADLTLEKWFGINQSSGEYDPKLLLTENEMKNYDIMITNTPTDQNRGYKTENTIITGNMVFRGDGGIEYSFSQEPGSTDSPMPVFSKITNGLVINNGQDTKNIAVGNIVIADKAQLKNVKFIYYDATTGKRVEGNAYDDDDKIYRKKSTAELELGSADAAKAAGMKPDQTVYVVYSGIDASFVIPNVLQENAGDDYTHVILPAERASQVQQSKILEQYYNNGK
jgi:hypothetical protein